jgi:hypothetical protein
VFEESKAKEQRVSTMVTLCNSYLSGKKLFYDSNKFDLRFILTDEDGGEIQTLSPDALSSGEKQIVSLFCHMLLSKPPREDTAVRKYFVIIDEPELSISVDWQKKFLTNIRSVETCGGLLAVTHSPFVFLENSLRPHARSIEEFKILSSAAQTQKSTDRRRPHSAQTPEGSPLKQSGK